jgi:hypothetical protein
LITRNLDLIYDGDPGSYSVRFLKMDNPELDELFKKHAGKVCVKVCKPDSKGTEQQNRAMHALLTAYYKSGFHSAPPEFSVSLEFFKIWVKAQYGPYWEINGKCILKSWADYTKQERMALIDGLISEIEQAGAYAGDWNVKEIIDGMRANIL